MSYSISSIQFLAMDLGAMSILLTGLLMDRSATVDTTTSQVAVKSTSDGVVSDNNNGNKNLAYHRKRLNGDLIRDYESNQVPVNANGTGVNVTIYMWPYDILYVNEARGSIKISGWIDMRWQDPFLIWNESDYGGIKNTHLPSSRVWLPAVDLFYSKEDLKIVQKCPTCPVRVDNKGNVLQGYYFSYSFPCAINVKYFPFDEQNCSLELANWHLDDSMMDLYAQGTSVDLSIFLPNEEWDLMTMNVTRKREFYNYGYFPILSYTLEIRRKSGYYVQNLVIPTLILTITALLGYHMPSTGTGVHQEKVKMGLTTILSIFILQLGVSDKLPRTSDVIPLIFVFYSGMVGLLSFAIISTSMIILVEKQGIYGKPVPYWARRFVPGLQTSVCPNGSQCRKQHECNCDNMMGNEPLLQPLVTTNSSHSRHGSFSRANGTGTTGPHKHCRMLDCGCRLKTVGPRPGYVLLSPENSPQPNRVIAIGNGVSSNYNSQQDDRSNHHHHHQQQLQSSATLIKTGYQGSTTGPIPPHTVLANPNTSPNHHHSSSSTNNPSASLHPPSPTALSIAILEALNNLRTVGEDLRSETVKRQYNSRIKAEWRRAADVLEYISLMCFLLASALFTVLFAYHSWY